MGSGIDGRVSDELERTAEVEDLLQQTTGCAEPQNSRPQHLVSCRISNRTYSRTKIFLYISHVHSVCTVYDTADAIIMIVFGIEWAHTHTHLIVHFPLVELSQFDSAYARTYVIVVTFVS